QEGGLIRQLNRGAQEAKGDILFFLPADSRLLENLFQPIERALQEPGSAGGGFTLDYGEELRWKILSAGANFRGRRLGLPMGDQGIFLRREDFERLGGFREGPLLPDLDLMKRLSHYGKITVLPERLGTSPRRYEQNGLFRNWVLNQALFITHQAFPEKAPAWAIAALGRLRRR
ncbi:MAG: glycosyltransferase, partial [Bdellovibrionota bacterium]